MTRPLLRALRRDRRGNTIVEFGLCCVPFTILLLGLGDLGFRQYISSMVQGSMDQAARQVTVGGVTPATITSFVTGNIRTVLPGATVAVVSKSYQDFSSVGKPEPITTDTAPIGTYNTGDCFTDLNGNKAWDSDASKSGNGSGDDIVYYTATVTYPALFPMNRLLGWPATETVRATTMMRNQPYAAQVTPATICT